MIDACERFIVPYGPHTEPWRLCLNCGHPKAQHEMPHCRSQAKFEGRIYECQRRTPHVGKCKSGDAEWGME